MLGVWPLLLRWHPVLKLVKDWMRSFRFLVLSVICPIVYYREECVICLQKDEGTKKSHSNVNVEVDLSYPVNKRKGFGERSKTSSMSVQ